MRLTFTDNEYYMLLERFERTAKYKYVNDIVFRKVENLANEYGDFTKISFWRNDDSDINLSIMVALSIEDGTTEITGFSEKDIESNLILNWINAVLSSYKGPMVGFDRNYINLWGEKN